jgi:hypothetical protein
MTREDYLLLVVTFEGQLNKMRRIKDILQSERFMNCFLSHGDEVITDVILGDEEAIKEWLSIHADLRDLSLRDLKERARRLRLPTYGKTRLELIQLLQEKL